MLKIVNIVVPSIFIFGIIVSLFFGSPAWWIFCCALGVWFLPKEYDPAIRLKEYQMEKNKNV